MKRVMEFATEDEMLEVLGEDAKGFDIRSGWASRVETAECPAPAPAKKEKNVLIGAYICNNYMYLSKQGTTFIKGEAKKFPDCEATDKKIASMNKHGGYKWYKIDAAN